jgi:hypothetical protein
MHFRRQQIGRFLYPPPSSHPIKSVRFAGAMLAVELGASASKTDGICRPRHVKPSLGAIVPLPPLIRQ